MAKKTLETTSPKTWEGGHHISAALVHPNNGYTKSGDYRANKFFLNAEGELRAAGGCGSDILVADNKKDMETIAEFVANCCGKTLADKPA